MKELTGEKKTYPTEAHDAKQIAALMLCSVIVDVIKPSEAARRDGRLAFFPVCFCPDLVEGVLY